MLSDVGAGPVRGYRRPTVEDTGMGVKKQTAPVGFATVDDCRHAVRKARTFVGDRL